MHPPPSSFVNKDASILYILRLFCAASPIPTTSFPTNTYNPRPSSPSIASRKSRYFPSDPLLYFLHSYCSASAPPRRQHEYFFKDSWGHSFVDPGFVLTGWERGELGECGVCTGGGGVVYEVSVEGLWRGGDVWWYFGGRFRSC